MQQVMIDEEDDDDEGICLVGVSWMMRMIIVQVSLFPHLNE